MHSYLKLKNSDQIAYCKTEGKGPGIIFLGGFLSEMTGEKATAVEAFCKQRGQAFVRFDYRGRGQSSGVFEDHTIGTWKEDALAILSKLTKGPQLLIGSSMGGWLALLLAMEKPKRVAGIIGLASAPDFTEHLIWEKLTKAQQQEIIRKGKITVPSDMGGVYSITRKLIEDGRNHLLLHKREIPIDCPVRLLHGLKDDDVPWEVSLSINEKLASQDVKTILIENGDHRLSKPEDIQKLLSITEKMLEKLK